jgi:hypothetical protein
MSAVESLADRRELVDELRDLDGVRDVDFTRDGFETIVVRYDRGIEVRSSIAELAEPPGYGVFPAAGDADEAVVRLEYLAPPEK